MCEILAPAGDKSSALAAINAGADAIYLGLTRFSARSSAENFDIQTFKEIIGYARLFGVKVYVAMNILIKDSELEDFIISLVEAWNNGADAIIISDIFVGKYIKQQFPEIILHLSTQAGICNVYGAELAKEFGFSRVILARETSLEDIKAIAGIIETEVFVQGALCTCFSGQCYLSSFAGGNSGNRGRCKQPCRKKYSIDREGYEIPEYRLSLADLCLGEDIKILENAGVKSFKIEGRLRRAEYVSAAVNYYKKCLNNCAEKSDLSYLKRTYNRGNYTKGLAFGQSGGFISSAVQGHIGEFVGIIKVENGKYLCQSRQKFTFGDGFKILREGKEIGGGSFGGENKSCFIVNSKARLKNGDKVFVTTDTVLNSRLVGVKRNIKLNVSAKFFEGKVPEIFINGKVFKGENILETAQNNPLTVDGVKNCFKKVDKYPFYIEFGEIEVENVFVPTSVLNALRREIFSKYYEFLTENHNFKYEPIVQLPNFKSERNNIVAVIATDLSGVSANVGILKISSFSDNIEKCINDFNGEKYLYFPPFATESEVKSFILLAEKFDGIYCDGNYGFYVSKMIDKPFFAGTGINLSNRLGVNYIEAKYFCLSKELTLKEIAGISKQNSFYLSVGDIKVMDLVYCPFGKKCSACDMRGNYVLTDENSRKFPIRRYKTSECRFEIYNCAALAVKNEITGILADFSIQNASILSNYCKSTETLKQNLGNCTRGHSDFITV